MIAASNQPVFTIGHSNSEIGKFVALLKQHGVQALADVRSSPRLERALEEAARAAAEEDDFDVVEHRFDLVGVCADCR